MDKIIGIIGANGFLGKELFRVLSKCFNVCAITRENYSENISKTFDVLINANGNSKKYWANQNPLQDFYLSVESVYKSIFNFKYEKYVYISSFDAGADNSYGLHKKMAEEIVAKHCTQYNVIRCPAIIGKDMVKGALKDILENKELFVTKDSRLQFITHTEIANKMRGILEEFRNGALYRFGSINNISIEEIGKLVNKPIQINENAKHQYYNDPCLDFKTAEEYIKDIL